MLTHSPTTYHLLLHHDFGRHNPSSRQNRFKRDDAGEVEVDVFDRKNDNDDGEDDGDEGDGLYASSVVVLPLTSATRVSL